MKKLRYLLEYVLLRSLVGVFDLLPLGWSFALARGLGCFLFCVARKRRRLAIANILLAGIATDEKEATRIARESFIHFVCVFLETLQATVHLSIDRSYLKQGS